MLPFSYCLPELYGPSLLSILKPHSFISFFILTSSKTKNSGSGPKKALSPTPDDLRNSYAFLATHK